MIHKRVTLATITGLTAALALTACGGANGDTTLNTSSGQAVTQDLSQADPQAADDGGDAQGGDAQGGDAQGDDAQGGGVAAAGGGYGSADGSSSDGYGSSGGDSSATALAGTVTTLLRAKKTKTMGWILVNQNGKTLYRFDQDEDDPPTSTCKGACNVKWPLALAGSKAPRLQGVPAGLLGTVRLSNGRKALTLKGWTLYEFSGDKVEGDWNGHGLQGVWWAIQPNGKKAMKCTPRASSGNSGSAGGGSADSGSADSGSGGGYSY